jgi:FemAB-related protein (PEP-CTERM system-associated)
MPLLLSTPPIGQIGAELHRTDRLAPIDVACHSCTSLLDRMPRLEEYALQVGQLPLSRHPGWLLVLRNGLRQRPYCLEATQLGRTRGILPLVYVKSQLFGRFLVGLPYLNYGGCLADHDNVALALVDRAAVLADELQVRYLELRQELPLAHPRLTEQVTTKVHMRLGLPESPGKLWDKLSPKVRNLVRKGQKHSLEIAWGTHDLLREFYAVFSRNMRDLGTPVYSKRLFNSILERFADRAEICVIRSGRVPIGAALLLHGWGITEVPSASTLREFNPTSANMLMYWHLLERAVHRKQQVFDFGRSSVDSNTYRFKKQWGAEPHAAAWQYFLRVGAANQMRPDNPQYVKLIRAWQKLPVWFTRLVGPSIVRGIP